MSRGIDLYGQGVAALKKTVLIASGLAERLSLPEEALLRAEKLTVVAGRRVLIENHRGILSYGTGHIEIGVQGGKICLDGTGLKLDAMNVNELLLSGELHFITWE